MPNRLNILTTLFKNWGFQDASDYLGTVLGMKAMPYYSLIIQVVAAVLMGLYVFIADWVWEPPGAALLIISMDLLNARYGYLVSKTIKGESFSWKKFHRTFGMVVSDILLLSMIHHAIKFYPYYAPLSHILFGWLFMHRVGAIIKHMADLKLQDGGLKRYLLKWFFSRMKSEVGAHIVDNIHAGKVKPREGENEH